MSPEWFQLLNAQQLRGRYAITIPFIIGSLRHQSHRGATSSDFVRQEIFNLLTSFLDEVPEQRAIRISRCPDINQPVVAQFYSAYLSTNGLKSTTQGRQTVFVDTEFAPEGKFSITSLTEQLFEELHAAICAGNFTFRGGVYVPFTSEDDDFIAFSKKIVTN